MPDVPYNTPETLSIVNDNASVGSADGNVVIDAMSRDEKKKKLPRTKSSINGEKVDESATLASSLEKMTRIRCSHSATSKAY